MFGKKKKYVSAVLVDEVLVSEEILKEVFTCDIAACKGACCVEGDFGAPLEPDERQILEDIYSKVEPYLPEKGKQAIRQQGQWVKDITGDYTTPLVEGRECAFTVFEENGTASCGIEKAHADGVIDFKKPISCHLYPIRVIDTKYTQGLNYDRWNICSPACALGEKTGLRVFEFLKEPLERKYGVEWYEMLEMLVEEREDN